MVLHFQRLARCRPWMVLTAAALLAVPTGTCLGQGPMSGTGRTMPAPRLAQSPQSQSTIQPGTPYAPPGQGQGPQSPTDAGAPGAPPAPMAPSGTPDVPSPSPPFGPSTAPSAPAAPPTSALDSIIAGEQFAARGGSTVAIADNVGYIDSAIIRSRVRLRFDSAYGDNRPDRAEFLYPKCGCFGLALGGTGPRQINPRSTIAGGASPSVNYQEFSTYLEYAANRNFSAFIEMPVRAIQPKLIRSANGFSDLNLGFKYAFVAEPDRFTTFQFRAYAPTGAGDKGLGTNHTTLEPGLLIFRRLTDRLYFSGEFLDWIPVKGSDFAGNVLIYGAGLTYNIVLSQHFRVAPVAEFVGWTVLSGKQLNPVNPTFNGGKADISSAAGDTIVNGKFGLRIGLGNYDQAGGGSALNDKHSLYIGYGRSLTGDHWYKDMLRLEYNYWF